MQEKEITIQDIISKRKQHSRRVDTKLIMKAYNLANEGNNGDNIGRNL